VVASCSYRTGSNLITNSLLDQVCSMIQYAFRTGCRLLDSSSRIRSFERLTFVMHAVKLTIHMLPFVGATWIVIRFYR